MPTTKDELFAFLDQLGITHKTISHRPVFTVEDGKDVWPLVDGLHCKNLFLKDKKGKIWLVVMPAAARADLGQIEKIIGAARLSFGKPDLLMEVLGVTPGSVPPFALINDQSRRVTPVLDQSMLQSPYVNYHPLRNDHSTTIASADLLRFVNALHYQPLIVNCSAVAQSTAA
ncbi:MAG: prolyl-tRNA synthetase associated domain-containing protein [Alphaproteobacteria bacterium]|nr:prolyl-tRNA synthetase associated domain-containing protein [Alphaproteobacteria bacterium]